MKNAPKHVAQAARQQPMVAPRRQFGPKAKEVVSRSALHILLSETIAFLLIAGLSKKSLASELQKEAQRLGSGGRLLRSRAAKVVKQGHENLMEIAGVLHDWYRQVAYIDRKSGEPRPLNGNELRKLIGGAFRAKRFPQRLNGWKATGSYGSKKADYSRSAWEDKLFCADIVPPPWNVQRYWSLNT